jgi:hypothetical protein
MIMLRRKWICLWVGIAPICLLLAADQLTFKTIKARDAKVAYDEAMNKAQVEYNAKVLAAKRNYRSRLENAKGAVLQSADLEEANKLAAEMKKLDQEIKERAVPQDMRGLFIARARWGVGDKWVDITELVRKKNSGEVLARISDVPDPAWGKSKTCVIEGMYGGREFVLSFSQAGVESLVFGLPSEVANLPR